MRGESKIGEDEVEEPLRSLSDSALLRRGLSSAFPERRGLDRVPAAPITFSPAVSSIGSHVLSTSRMSTAMIWRGRSRARLDHKRGVSKLGDSEIR